MRKGTMVERLAFTCFLAITFLLATAPTIARAQTRRAVLVGIDHYVVTYKEVNKPNPKSYCALERLPLKGQGQRETFGDLDGATNDVKSIRTILVDRLGFDPKNIVVLLDQEATADAILCSIRRQLIEAAQPGDMSVFYYAGHGSRIRNTRTDQPDGYDQTIVPADSWRGTPDIRNKELVRLFREAAAKGVILTVIADSCHSGAIGRGPLTSAGKARMLDPDSRYVEDPPDCGPDGKPLPKPEDIYDNILVFSAAARDECAWEHPGDVSHGLFTWALTKVLNEYPDERADIVLQRVISLMRQERPDQEPWLDGKGQKSMTLFGQRTTAGGGVAVAVAGVSEKDITLNGGTAVGLYKDCELKKFTHNQTEAPVRLRVTDSSLAVATAEVIDGRIETVHTGDLFAIDKWVVPERNTLRVCIAQAHLPFATIQTFAGKMEPVRASSALVWVDDPSVIPPTHIMSWDGSQWKLDATDPKGSTIMLGKDPSPAEVLKALPAKPMPRLFLLMPPATEVVDNIQLGEGTPNNAVWVQKGPSGAHYLLVGRAGARAVEYAWIRPNMTEEQARRKEDAMPLKSDWISVSKREDAGESAKNLRELALRVARLHAWLSLESPPPPPDKPIFPYYLAFQDKATGELFRVGKMLVGKKYEAVLEADPRLIRQYSDAADVPRRYIYLVHIDEWGKSVVLFPSLEAGAEGNHLPYYAEAAQEKLKETISLYECDVDTATPDTYYLLVADKRLPDPSVLEVEAFRSEQAGARGGSDPLSQLLVNTGSATRGIKSPPVSPNWSIEKVTIQCVEK